MKRYLPLLLCLSFTGILLNGQGAIGKKYYNVDENNLALKGFDPVAYFIENKAVKGNPNWKSTHNGIHYYFSKPEHQKLFEADPESYLPQYGGFCAFGMAADEKIHGFAGNTFQPDPEIFKVVDNKLYLFYEAEFFNSLNAWNASKEATMINRADRLWAEMEKSHEQFVLPKGMNPKAPPALTQMAFLVGEWNCTVKRLMRNGKYGSVENGRWTGRFSEDGYSIIDSWGKNMPGEGINVRSYSPYHKKWNMTWTSHKDMANATLEGKRQGDNMVFKTIHYQVQGQDIINKITFHNITTDSFDYFIDASYDQGKTWYEKAIIINAKRIR